MEIKNNSDIRLIRDGKVIYTGKIKSLFREKNEAKEVKAGLECGIGLRDFNDIKKNDILETFPIIYSQYSILISVTRRNIFTNSNFDSRSDADSFVNL